MNFKYHLVNLSIQLYNASSILYHKIMRRNNCNSVPEKSLHTANQ